MLAEMGVDGSNYRAIYKDEADLSGITWTTDQTGILFARRTDKGEQRKIMSLPVDGGEPTFTGVEVTGGESYDLSPDGSRLALNERKSVSELWALDNLLAAMN